MLNHTLLRLTELSEKEGFTLYRLAKKSSIPYSTLNSLFKNNNDPTVSTLQKLCNGLGITLSEFFSSKEFEPNGTREYLSKDEYIMINKYRDLSKKDKKNIIGIIDVLKK